MFVCTQRRLNNLVHVSGLIEQLQPIRARPATHDELCRCERMAQATSQHDKHEKDAGNACNTHTHTHMHCTVLASTPPPCRVHTPRYVEHVRALSADKSKIGHRVGDEVSMSPGGYEIAALAAGGSIALVDAALSGAVTNGYALTRCDSRAREHCTLARACA